MLDRIMLDDGWVIRNLREYGNSLIPNELVEMFGVEGVQRLIYSHSRMEVRIRRVDPIRLRDPMTGKMIRDTDEMYIAEI